MVAHTRKGAINRQFSIKVAKQLGSGYTVASRMGSVDIKMGVDKTPQDVKELYIYIYVTPKAEQKS